jgi:hypothetical protein
MNKLFLILSILSLHLLFGCAGFNSKSNSDFSYNPNSNYGFVFVPANPAARKAYGMENAQEIEGRKDVPDTAMVFVMKGEIGETTSETAYVQNIDCENIDIIQKNGLRLRARIAGGSAVNALREVSHLGGKVIEGHYRNEAAKNRRPTEVQNDIKTTSGAEADADSG